MTAVMQNARAEQVAAALSLAIETKSRNAALRREVADPMGGKVSGIHLRHRARASAAIVADVLRVRSADYPSVRLDVLLAAMPQSGDQHAWRWLRAIGVSKAEPRVRDLGPNQREELALLVLEWAERAGARVGVRHG